MCKRRSLVAGACSALLAALLTLPSAATSYAQQSMTLSSNDFSTGAAIPAVHEGNLLGCTGQNLPLTLSWSGIPVGTRSLALTMVDYTAATKGGFAHWIVYNIPASSFGTADSAFAGASMGVNDAGSLGYVGPCPPVGSVHTYTMTLFALDTTLQAKHLSLGPLMSQMSKHVVASATVTGTFAR